jgi:CheY-like chemotaxis protein
MPTSAPLKALVVEDQELFRDAISDELTYFGFQTRTAIDGEEGLSVAINNDFDLILSDMRMPNRDGKWFLNELRKLKKTAPPFIFMTGFSDLSPQDAFEMGADGFLAKPLNSHRLSEVISKVCKPMELRWCMKPKVAAVESFTKSFESILDSKQIVAGRGGIFLETLETPLRVGDLINFDLSFSSGPVRSLVGIGSIVWRRESGIENFSAGYGIDFEYLSDASLPDWIKLLKSKDSIAFVPKG